VAETPILRTNLGPNALTAVADALSGAWASATWVPDAIRNQIDMAVAEIAANIVEHATRIHAATVQMQMRIFPNHVEVDFTDDGEQPDIDLDAVQMPDELAERGRGLAIAKALLAQLVYTRSEAGNHWRLVSRPFR
jgi:serine/threonine-protein kinase RsbW